MGTPESEVWGVECRCCGKKVIPKRNGDCPRCNALVTYFPGAHQPPVNPAGGEGK